MNLLAPAWHNRNMPCHKSLWWEALLGGRWILDIAHNLNHDLLREYFTLWIAIESVQLDFEDSRKDTIIWTLESSGEYSAKSAYTIQFAGHLQSAHPVLIWKAWASSKCKARLLRRQWENNYFCALCERNLETTHHLFFECPYSRLVWQLVASWSSCSMSTPGKLGG